MSETKEFEKAVAGAWFDGAYTEKQAELSAEIQGLDFENIKYEFSVLYHEQECRSADYE